MSGLEPSLSNKIPDPVEQCLARSARFREAHPLVLCAQRPNDDEQVINLYGTPPFSIGSVSSRKRTGLGGWTPANDRGPDGGQTHSSFRVHTVISEFSRAQKIDGAPRRMARLKYDNLARFSTVIGAPHCSHGHFESRPVRSGFQRPLNGQEVKRGRR